MARFDSILGTVGRTPIVRINRLAPPHVNLYVKIEAANPMGGSAGFHIVSGTTLTASAGGISGYGGLLKDGSGVPFTLAAVART